MHNGDCYDYDYDDDLMTWGFMVCEVINNEKHKKKACLVLTN